jgi:Tfp pilus assembly protein PilN
MDCKDYGNFLTDKDIACNEKNYKRNIYLFGVHAVLVFLLCGFLVEGAAWGYSLQKYAVPQAAQVEQQYEKGKAINKKIQTASVDLRQAETENLKVLSFLTLLAKNKPAAVTLTSLAMTKNNIQILGASTDVTQVAKFTEQLKAENFGPARIEKISEKDNQVSFTIMLDAQKKAAPKPSENKAEGGASNAK